MDNKEIQERELKYIKVPVSVLVPYARNTRTHTDQQIDQVAASIREFGFMNPVIINGDNTILAGHARVLASKKLGLEYVPCLIADYLSEAQKKAFIIADNKIAENAGWDTELLKVELEDLKGADFDVEILGFTDKELNKIFDEGKETEDDNFDLNKALDEKAFVELGDVWLLGKHRLMCGDSTKEEDVKILMDGNKANACITDPPFNVNIQGGAHVKGKRKEGGLKILNDNFKTPEEFFNFLLSAFKNIYESLVDGGAFYCFHSDSEKVNFYNATVSAGFHYSSTCIWVKDTLVIGRSDYQQRHEPVIYAFKDTAKHEWFSDRKQTTVWEFERPKKSELHPTMKPIKLIAYPMKNSTQENAIIYEPFGGSGSTLIAGEQLNRKVYSMELDPKYASAIIRRLISLRNKKTDDIFCIRNGQKLNCIDVYDPSTDDFTFKEQMVDG